MGDELDKLTEAAEKLHRTRTASAQRVRELGGLTEELGRIRAIVHSPDGSVAVAAGAGGTVQDVRFSPQAFALGPEGLRTAVMSTLRSAVAAAARQQAQLVQQYVGGDLDVVGRVRATQSAPEQHRPVPSPPRQAPPRPSAADPGGGEYQLNMVRRPKGHR